MAGETVLGSLRYEFTADTSGLRSGLNEVQSNLKRMTDQVRESSRELTKQGEAAKKSVGLTKNEFLNLTRQLSDAGISLAGGMSPFTVLIQQGPQVLDVFQQTKASWASIAGQIALTAAKTALSLRNLGLAVGGAFAAAEISASVARSKLADLSEQAKKASMSTEALFGAQVKGAKVGLSNDDVTSGLQNAAQQFEQFKRNTGGVLDTVKDIDKSFLKALDNTRSFGEFLDVVAGKIATLPATQARDLAESVFPADKAQKFVEMIKQGEFSVAAFQRAADQAGGGFARIASQAAELRTRIAAADEEVNARLLVSLAKLPTPIGNVASLWTDIKTKIADLIPIIHEWLSEAGRALGELKVKWGEFRQGIDATVKILRADLMDALNSLKVPIDAFAGAWDVVIEKIGKASEGAKILTSLYKGIAKLSFETAIEGQRALNAYVDSSKGRAAPASSGAGVKLPSMAVGFDKGVAGSQFKPSEMFLSTVQDLKGPRTGDARKSYEDAKADAGGKGAKAQTDQIKSYLDSLHEAATLAQAEADNWSKGNLARERAVELSKLELMAKREGRELTAEERANAVKDIEQKLLAEQKTEDQRAALDRLNDSMREFADLTASAMDALVIQGQKASEVLRQLLKQLSSAALRGLLTGDGMFGNLFGLNGSKEGGLGGLLGKAVSFLPKFAAGGTLGAGRWGIAGEAGPELIRGPAHVTPFGKMGQQGQKVTIINNAGAQVEARQLSDGELLVMVNKMVDQKMRRVPGMLADAQRRSM